MATSPFPFTYPPPPARNPPLPTQIHGYHHPSPFFYPSPTQIHGGLYPPPLYSGGYYSATPTYPDQAPGVLLPANLSYSKAETNGNPFLPNAAPTAPTHERQPPQPWVASVPSPGLSFRPQLNGVISTFVPPPPPQPPAYYYPPDPNSSLPDLYSQVHAPPPESTLPPTPAPPATSTSSPACGYSTEAAAILHRVQRELLNIQARLCQHQAREEISFNTLQGELAKLKLRVSQCAISAGKQSTRATPGSSPLQVIRTTPVASKAFDKMPIPSSGHGTEATTPNYCDGHQTPIQSSCMQGGDINLNCPSHRAVPEPECIVGDEETEDSSNEFVQVFTGTPEQQRYEVEQHESRQAPKSLSRPKFSPERPTAGIDIEQLLNCPCQASECRTWDEEFQGDENLLCEKSVCQTATGHSISIFPWDPGASTPPYSSKLGAVVQRLRDLSRNVLLVVPERRQKWDPSNRKTIMDIPHDVKWYFRIQVSSHLSMLCDPGASLPPLSINTQQPDQAFRPTIHASTLIGNFEKLHGHEYVALLADSNVTGFSKYTCLSFWVQNNIVLLWKSEIAWPKQSVGTGASSVWDPGIWSLMDMLLGNAAVPNLVPSGLHIHKIQLADCAAIHACNLGFALLPHTQITASGSSNLEVHELASPYVGFHLHLSTKWTSTSPNGFQKNYNAKNLISSQNYLQLSEMDIIFTTFLPP